MEILTWIKYSESIPLSSGKTCRYTFGEDHVRIELREASSLDLQPAFITDGLVYYLYKDKLLYVKAQEKDVWARRDGITALEALEAVNIGSSTYFGFDPWETREVMIARAEADMQRFLLVDGDLYITIGEPRYHVATFGCGNNHGGTALMVSNGESANCSPDCYFSALDADLAIKAANEAAERRGDTNDIGTFRATIRVLMPEAVTLPTRNPSTAKESYCKACCHRLPQDQLLLPPSSPDRWRFCPYCGTPIVAGTHAPLEPGELHCKICNSWLGTIEENGNSYASSAYNGTDICDSCMIEHCLSTNCFACKIGEYPNCQFVDQKRFYLEEARKEQLEANGLSG
jgi:hypothetical protein